MNLRWCFCKATAIFHLQLMRFAFLEGMSLSIPELHLFLYPSGVRIIIVMMTVFWLSMPFKEMCCNGTWSEVAYHLTPTILVLLLNLGQWNFPLFVVLCLILAVLEVLFLWRLEKAKVQRCDSPKEEREFKKLRIRGMIVIGVLWCVGPSIYYAFKNGVVSPDYYAAQDLWREIISDAEIAGDPSEEMTGEVAGELNEEDHLWQALQENTWKSLPLQGKMNVLQQLTNYETMVLNIPHIDISSSLISPYTYGGYSDKRNVIRLNVEHISNDPVEEVINTICHEVRHSFQWWAINAIDWDNSIFQSEYFKELRVWQENYDLYKSAEQYGFESYRSQPIEVDARNYAEKETERILELVER